MKKLISLFNKQFILNLNINRKMMKKGRLIILLSVLLMLGGLNGFSQDPPPPPANHGQTTDQQSGGSAPLGSGIALLLAMGAAYGARKVYTFSKNKREKEE
ncbi:MAG: hypothetical protein STSR0006_08710 [Lentimicrobium sp.]